MPIDFEIFQILVLSLFFMILILINASSNMAFAMMIILVLMASLVVYLNCKMDDMETYLFRLLLISILLIRIYIMLVSRREFYLPILCISIICCCILAFNYSHENLIKMLAITSIMFSLICFTFIDDYGQDSGKIITTNIDKLKNYLNSIVPF